MKKKRRRDSHRNKADRYKDSNILLKRSLNEKKENIHKKEILYRKYMIDRWNKKSSPTLYSETINKWVWTRNKDKYLDYRLGKERHYYWTRLTWENGINNKLKEKDTEDLDNEKEEDFWMIKRYDLCIW